MSEPENKNENRFGRIRGYLKRYKLYLIIGGLAVVASNGLMLINPYLMKTAFDKLEQKEPPSEIFNIALTIVALAIGSGFFRFVMRRTIIWMSRKIEFDLRSDLFQHLLKLNPTFYHNTKTGDIMARTTNDAEAVRMMVGPGIMHICNAFVSTVIALSFMFYLSPKLTLYSLIPLPILSIVVNRLGTAVHKRYAQIQEYFSVLTSRVQESMSGVRVIRAYNQEDHEVKDFSRHSREYIKLNIRMIKIQGIFFPMLFTLAGAVNLSVFYFGGRAVIGGEISLGTLVAFFAYLTMLIWPMIAMGWVVSLYQRGTASLKRINGIFNTEPEVADSIKGTNVETIKGKIEFKNLSFGYNDEDILHDINLKIEPGMSVGIIGPTASGKTTLVSLLSRLFPINRGQLFIDDTDINDITLETLRSNIGFVPQEPFLFSDTITNNILFAIDDGDESQAREAAYKAVIDSEIDQFPNGFESELGERGISLSGGQKQRVAIARALVSDPPILVLDDATSAVDTETEHAINQKLSSELKKRTSIIISHRASAVKDADLIIYLEEGRIAEFGNYKQLIDLDKKYAGVYKMQLLEQELENM